MTTRSLTPVQLLVILTGLNLFNYIDRFVLNAVRTPIADEFHLSDTASGWMVTAFMIGYFLTAPIFGYVGDRAPRKWLIAAGILVWSLGTVLTGFASGFGILLCFRVLVGVGEASYATISPALISDAWGSDRRNNALTIFYVAIPVGSALGFVLGGWIAHAWGWRSAFLWVGAPGLLLALILLPFREPERGAADARTGEGLHKPGLREILGLLWTPRYSMVVWGYVAYTFVIGAFALWGPAFLERYHGLSTAHAATFFGVVLVVAGLVGTLFGGFLATAWHRRNPAAYAWTLALSILAAAPTCVLALLIPHTAVAMTLIALAMFLLFLSTGPVNTLIIETAPINLRASAMAVSIFCIHLFGDMWSPTIVGWISDRTGHDLRRAMLLLPTVLLLGGALWLTLALHSRRKLA